MNAGLLTDIGTGATGAPAPAVPQPARVAAVAAATAVRARGGPRLPRRVRSWLEVTVPYLSCVLANVALCEGATVAAARGPRRPLAHAQRAALATGFA